MHVLFCCMLFFYLSIAVISICRLWFVPDNFVWKSEAHSIYLHLSFLVVFFFFLLQLYTGVWSTTSRRGTEKTKALGEIRNLISFASRILMERTNCSWVTCTLQKIKSSLKSITLFHDICRNHFIYIITIISNCIALAAQSIVDFTTFS